MAEVIALRQVDCSLYVPQSGVFVFFFALVIKRSQPWGKSYRFLTYTLLKGGEKQEGWHFGPTSGKKEKYAAIKASPGSADFPRRWLWKCSLFWE